MKQIKNKETTIEKENGKCHYSDLIELIIKKGKQGGLTYEDIENRLVIGKAIKESNGVIELEDGYFNYLKKSVKEMTWNVVHEDLIKFRNDINEIK